MARTIVLLFDSFGIGAAEDAEKFGDVGADTLGHIAERCANGKADQDGLRSFLELIRTRDSAQDVGWNQL